MKCEIVQELAFEYSEGALCVADELCVDIHLIQCDNCRAEIHAHRAIQAAIGLAVDEAVPDGDPIALLDSLDRIPEQHPRSWPVSWKSLTLPAFRFAAAAILVAWAVSAGLAGLERNAGLLVGPSPVNAGQNHPLAHDWRKWMEDNPEVSGPSMIAPGRRSAAQTDDGTA